MKTGWTWIVSWVLVVSHYTSPTTEVDKYGRVLPCVYAVAIMHTTRERHSAKFTDRDKAYQFYNSTVKDTPKDIDSLRIDSTYSSRLEETK